MFRDEELEDLYLAQSRRLFYIEKELDTFQALIDGPKRGMEILHFANALVAISEKDWEKFVYGRYKKLTNSTDPKDKAKLFKSLRKILNESVITESDDTPAMLLAKDIEGAEYHTAFGDGNSVWARSTDKTWDDGVPVLKHIARAKKKQVDLPKGKFEMVEDSKYGWYYFFSNAKWHGIQIKDYGTPPFDY
jgi:hypothetical protein